MPGQLTCVVGSRATNRSDLLSTPVHSFNAPTKLFVRPWLLNFCIRAVEARITSTSSLVHARPACSSRSGGKFVVTPPFRYVQFAGPVPNRALLAVAAIISTTNCLRAVHNADAL